MEQIQILAAMFGPARVFMFIENKNIGNWLFRSFFICALAGFLVGGILGIKTLAAQTKESQTYTVCAQDCDFTGVQEAVDQAQPQDTIQIKGGKYNEEVKIKKNVTLQAYGNKDEIQGSVYFASPSLTVPQRTTVYISKIVPAKKEQFPEAAKEKNTKKTSNTIPGQEEASGSPTISTPLFDVSIQSKTQDKTNRDVIITLLIFLVILLTIIGYFVFGYIVHKKNKSDKDKESPPNK
ncbi:MAG TPA: hypothetical protein VKO42_02440 [Patescibacteria group bacterium]|nr:hypothetical protein [Patescibacteria group bacterium]